VDMRKGFEGLYGLVRDHLGQDPLSGHLFLFTNRTRTRLKAWCGMAADYGCARSVWSEVAFSGRRRKRLIACRCGPKNWRC
jgi:predicted RNA-binding Zn ribbon-like protein